MNESIESETFVIQRGEPSPGSTARRRRGRVQLVSLGWRDIRQLLGPRTFIRGWAVGQLLTPGAQCAGRLALTKPLDASGAQDSNIG